MMKERKIYQQVTSKDICHAYELLLNKELVSFPLTVDGKKKVEAIVSSINSSYFGNKIYITTEEKAIAYLYFLIKDHPFTDGNKRTACLVFEIFCDINSLAPNFKTFRLDQLVVFIEKIKEDNHQDVIKDITHLLFEN